MNNSLIMSSGSLYIVSGSLPKISGSIHANELTGSAIKSNLFLDPTDNSSFIISGSNPTSSFYMSSSGKFGFGTTDPLVSFDIRADEFQIQKTGKRQGIKVNKEGNIESFNSETDAAATGSEFILSYTRGGAGAVTAANLRSILGVDSDEITKAGGAAAFFSSLKPRDQDKILFLLEREGGNIDKASVGDVLGSIRWVATSGSTNSQDSRTAGEAANITAIVNAANKYGTSADLIFKIADKAALEGTSEDLGAAAAPKTALILDGNFNHELTGSLTSTGNIISPNITADSGSFSTRVTANDAKTGISTSQASAITANTAKTGISAGQASAITANTAKASMVIGTTNKTALAGNTTTIGSALHLEGGALIPTTTEKHTVSLSVTNTKGTYALVFTMVDSSGKSPVTKTAEVSLK
tara:strand:+ start:2177 stop:3415 length:1239 start_codon:yes stop_codon:yes gene_type:complete